MIPPPTLRRFGEVRWNPDGPRRWIWYRTVFRMVRLHGDFPMYGYGFNYVFLRNGAVSSFFYMRAVEVGENNALELLRRD